MEVFYRIGVDCGSKTVKVAVLDEVGALVYKSYLYHQTNIRSTLARTLSEMRERIGDAPARFAFTGSAGMQIAEDLDLPFVQEVVASKRAVKHYQPDTDVVIELGGEDSKILFLTGGEELRMNATCAGGTGGFIDTIAGMLGTHAAGLARAYATRTTTRPIASRCAVFAQNDVRALLNEGAGKGDIAASAFAAVVNQCVSGLACGRKIEGKVVFLGGPLHYLEPLVECFRETLGLDEETGIAPENAHLYVALGAALGATTGPAQSASRLSAALGALPGGEDELLSYLEPLFENEDDYKQFKADHARYELPSARMWGYDGPLYLGVDSGSTTMKCVLVDDHGRLLRVYYQKNDGDVITSARRLMKDLYQSMLMAHTKVGDNAYIAKVAVTGYGEALLRKAFGFDLGLVETVAHLKAAQSVMRDVDCLLDIGGQDIKCIRVRDGIIDSISLNEACSSGCGALLGSFAHNMLMTDFAFAQSGLFSEKPVDLGMRCTVFMTSRVRHAQKVGASAGDISAGLAYSVVKNALYRVMNVHDVRELGENIVVQGGTFKNDAVLRAFEKTLGRQVARTDHPELMGAYGAALYALEHEDGKPSTILNAFRASTVKVERSSRRCNICTNACLLTESAVSHSTDEACEFNPMVFILKGVHSMGTDSTDKYRTISSRFIMGNRCTRPLAVAEADGGGLELVTRQYERLFRIDSCEVPVRGATVGIPRALAMYEQFPFWQAFFNALGISVVLSGRSSTKLYRKGMGNVTSESTCYPAKLAHGHVADLVDKGAHHVFYPRMRNVGAALDCPVICDYAHILEMGSLNANAGVSFISPRIGNAVFEGELGADDATALLEAVREVAPDVSAEDIAQACAAGTHALDAYLDDIAALVDEAQAFMRENGGWGLMLTCRPYHLDPEINHSIPTLLESSGFTVVTSDALWARSCRNAPSPATGWRMSDRQEQAVRMAVQTDDFEVVSLYSFGCGLDVCLHDELRGICREGAKTFTALKVDDMTDISSTRIRVRSLLATLQERDGGKADVPQAGTPSADTLDDFAVDVQDAAPTDAARYIVPHRLFLPNWMPVHQAFIRPTLEQCGFDVVVGPKGNGVGSGLAIVGSDPCQTILSSVGQLSEYLDSAAPGDKAALVVPFACSSCTARSIGRLAKSSVRGFGVDNAVVSLEELVSLPGVPDELDDALARAIVAGDVVMQASCRLLALGRGSSFAGVAQGLISDTLAYARQQGELARLDECALQVADSVLAGALSLATSIAVLGTASLALTPNLNNDVFDRIVQEGCEPIPVSLSNQAIHNARVETTLLGEAQAEALERFATRLSELQSAAFEHLGALGLGYAPTLCYDALADIAQEAGIDQGVHAGAGWCSQAAMLALNAVGMHDVLFAQTFTCLSSHVGGSALFKEVREADSQANLAAVEYDTGISQVNQISRIKLLASLAKDR